MPSIGRFTPSKYKDAMASNNIGYSFGSETFKGTKAQAADHFYAIATAKITKKEIGENLIPVTGPGDSALTYCRRVAMERLGVEPKEISVFALEWGLEWEPIARAEYEKEKMVSVQTVFQPIIHPDFDYVAGTPDGFVGEDGIIEIKCPENPENHMANLIDAKQLEIYKWQGQGYLWITGRKWYEFISFDTRFPDKLKLYVYRVERDEEMIVQLSERIELLESIVNEILEKL